MFFKPSIAGKLPVDLNLVRMRLLMCNLSKDGIIA